MMKRLSLLALLLVFAGADVFAQTRSQAQPQVQTTDGKRWIMVTLDDGTQRRVWLDPRTCEELSGRERCGPQTGMAAQSPSQPMNPPAQPNVNPAPTQQAEMTRGNTVVDLAMETDNFSTLVRLLQAAGLVETLRGSGPFTIFAPTNDAFAELGEAELNRLMDPANRGTLVSLLQAHVLPNEKLTISELRNRANLAANATEQSLAGPLQTASAEAGYTIEGSVVVQADFDASNGIIHSVNRVIVPAALQGKVNRR